MQFLCFQSMPKLRVPWKKSKDNNPAGAESSTPPHPRTTEPTHSTSLSSPQAGSSAHQLAQTESTAPPVPLRESTTTPCDPSHQPPSISPPSIEPSSISPPPSNPPTSTPKSVPHQNVSPVISKQGNAFFLSSPVQDHPAPHPASSISTPTKDGWKSGIIKYGNATLKILGEIVGAPVDSFVKSIEVTPCATC
jgi:hypothetical protein